MEEIVYCFGPPVRGAENVAEIVKHGIRKLCSWQRGEVEGTITLEVTIEGEAFVSSSWMGAAEGRNLRPGVDHVFIQRCRVVHREQLPQAWSIIVTDASDKRRFETFAIVSPSQREGVTPDVFILRTLGLSVWTWRGEWHTAGLSEHRKEETAITLSR